MKAIRFNASVPRYLTGRALGRLSTGALYSGLSCTALKEVPEPEPPAPGWVKVKTRYGGICGTDLSTVHLHTSPYYTPLSSFPCTLGHEGVGYDPVGERVVLEPLLWCRPRGFEDLCPACQRGETSLCERVTVGKLAPGTSIGFCRDTGGSWSEVFTAHESQLYRVPDSISDESALMVEPFSCGLHAVLQNPPKKDDTVLVLGAGTIGLGVLAALQALDLPARILVAARHPFQAEAARRLGATEIITGDLYESIAEHTGARLEKPIIGKRIMIGGADLTYECVGSDGALDDALRLTRSGGRVAVVGVPGLAKGVDWSSIFVKELQVHAAFGYHHAEQFQSRRWATFELAIDLMAKGKIDLGWMVTHRFKLSEYKRAFRMFKNKSRHQMIKAVFEFNPE